MPGTRPRGSHLQAKAQGSQGAHGTAAGVEGRMCYQGSDWGQSKEDIGEGVHSQGHSRWQPSDWVMLRP